MEIQPVFFFLVFLFWFYGTSDTPQQTPSYRKERESRVDQEEYALGALRNTTHGSFNPAQGRYLPFVGMRDGDGFGWDALELAQQKARKHVHNVKDMLERAHVSATSDSNGDGVAFPVYRNMTGYVRGDWVRARIPENISKPDVNLTSLVPEEAYVTKEFGRNVTNGDGTLRIELSDTSPDQMKNDKAKVKEVKVELTLHTDSTPYYGMSTIMHGVHIPDTGAIVVATTSEKFPGIFALPHFLLSSQHFEETKHLLNETISETIDQQKEIWSSMPASPWSASSGDANNILFPTPSCEYIMWLQQHAVVFGGSKIESPSFIQAVEDELRWPQGVPIPEAPPMILSAVIFSPDCGFILESKGPPDFPPAEALHLSGLKDESYARHIKDAMVAFCVLFALQTSLLMKQIKDASTPSMQSRISFYTVGIMATGDGVLFLLFLVLSNMSAKNYLILTCAAFLTFFGVAFLGMKFMLDIWTVQLPESQARERERRQRIQRAEAAIAAAQNASTELPPPATAPSAAQVGTGATPVILPSDQDLTQPAAATTPVINARSGASELYARFYFQLCAVFLLTTSSIFWPKPLRAVYVYAISFVYLGIWTPQIYRNVMRNCRKALRWDFVIGQSILRLTPFLYFYCVKGNVLFIETDTNAALALAGWLWIQLWALASQEVLGPRFFVREGWAPPAYDYHPVLRDTGAEDLESGGTMPIGYLKSDQVAASPTDSRDQTSSTANNNHKRHFDCAICMYTIDVPVIVSGRGGTGSEAESGTSIGTNIATSILGRRAYMVTPCRHIFHSVCLENWMRLRLQCPICRDDLPPL